MTNAPFFFGDTGGSDHSDMHYNQVSSSSYPSPLSEILHDLKQKHVVAATAASTSASTFNGSTISFRKIQQQIKIQHTNDNDQWQWPCVISHNLNRYIEFGNILALIWEPEQSEGME